MAFIIKIKAMKALLSKGCIEFFRNPDEPNVYFLKDGKVFPFNAISIDDAQALRNDLDNYPHKVKALEKAGIHNPMKQLEIYAGCVFGAFDTEPDFEAGTRTGYEYSPCSQRGTGQCIFCEVICDKGKFVMRDNVLTRRQVNVLSMTKDDLSEHQMAERIFRSPHTIKTTLQKTREILNIRSKAGLAAFATKHHM